MENNEAIERRKNDLALADLVGFLGGMVLIASIVFLLLGGIGFEQDRRGRTAMGRAVATVTEEYVHGGAYYVVYQADGAAHEALMSYEKGKLNVGDQVTIRYDRDWYNDVRLDAPKAMYVRILTWSALGLVLGGIALFGKAYLKTRSANPWDDDEGT